MLVTFPIAALASLYSKNWEVDFPFEKEKLPDSWTLMLSIGFMMLCEDFAFHFSHRFLHWRVIYPYLHKVHHTHKTTIGLAAEYTHPIDYLIGSIIPGALGTLILGKHCHFFTTLIWGFVRLGETLDGHSGYEFSWSPYRLIPFSTSARYHDFHHSHNIGNFSSFFSFWDTIEGTNKVYYQFYERMREARERHDKKKELFEKELNEKLEKNLLK
jgi:sterol desaturase/sphingolipid hydroxylase (fatty acid hydroxylase superfamily)